MWSAPNDRITAVWGGAVTPSAQVYTTVLVIEPTRFPSIELRAELRVPRAIVDAENGYNGARSAGSKSRCESPSSTAYETYDPNLGVDERAWATQPIRTSFHARAGGG